MLDNGKILLDDVYNSMQSWIAHAKVASSYRTKRSMLKLYNQLFNGYRITKKWEHIQNNISSDYLLSDEWEDFRWSCYAA